LVEKGAETLAAAWVELFDPADAAIEVGAEIGMLVAVLRDGTVFVAVVERGFELIEGVSRAMFM
jgi:hypothetical protein